MGDYLCGRLVEEYRELREVTENFDLANEAISEELRSEWAKLSTQPMQGAKKQLQSVFRYKSGKYCEVSATKAEVGEVSLSTATNSIKQGSTAFINGGITLLLRHDEPELAENPEDQDLGLPSDFDQGDRERLCLDSFAQIEKSLLEGLAHDALAAVREHIKHKKAYLQLKDEVIRNQGANTRAQGILKCAQNLMLTHANRYNFIRERLLLLGLSANDSTFRPLSTKDDLWMYSFNTSHTRRSEGLEPWYWTMRPVGNATDKEMQEWMLEVDHVRWFRQRALHDRHHEEVNILKEEFERTLRSFAAMSRAWSQTIQVSEEQSILGANAYAAKISAVYQEMHERCKQSYLLAIATHTEAGVELRGGLYHGLQLEIRQSVMRQISLAIPNTHVGPSTASSIKWRSFWDAASCSRDLLVSLARCTTPRAPTLLLEEACPPRHNVCVCSLHS
ncbi:uncharacterized protein LACBIDRAFT_335955 [Laccaria bicolor S238N-H82]|uniref:Predicted protein n=1 Tax=Laccaria bicolor (strain S238N-H82 / ATCC MYA-4686) TaxID=486041 RepID=B0E3Y3_LACBS|nr:uncharacterized protein LACBIDRAFT_335955 [Laccaria bicolor S238N-H82]EDQ98448.1 predicted protein [Laccaria bicolor S238N-H82]|eukprot:XP_001890901.1 predicted protein [Laccaria bicolor S238N-H82]